MKMIKKTTAVLASIAAVVAMTACSSDSSSGGGSGGGSTLATGGFIKSSTIPAANMYTGVTFVPTADMHVQVLYPSSEIEGSGYINEISFTYRSDLVADVICPDMTIKMGHTTLTDLTATFADNVEQGAGTNEIVRAGGSLTVPAGSAGDKFTIKLDTPFNYNGMDNLVVGFDRVAACDGTFEDLGEYVAPVSLVYEFGNTGTGITFAWRNDMDFTFAGGVNTIDYAGTTGNTWPFSTSLPRAQMLYKASDVNGSGPLTGVAFQVGAVTAEATYSATVKMGHTALTEFTSGTLFEDSYSATPTVMENNVTFTVPANLAVGDWFWVPLSGSFNYNGTDNLIVDINVTAATASTTLTRSTAEGVVRLTGTDGTATAASTTAYDTKFRFNGAPMSVVETNLAAYGVPLNSGGTGAIAIYGSQVFGTGATLNSIGFRVAQDIAADVTYTDANITIGHTTLTDLDATLAANMDDATVVYTGDITIPAGTKAGDWVTVPVSGFTYDPTKNLTVQMYPGTSANDILVYYGGNGVISNTGAMTPGSTTIDSGIEGSRHPHLQLGFTK